MRSLHYLVGVGSWNIVQWEPMESGYLKHVVRRLLKYCAHSTRLSKHQGVCPAGNPSTPQGYKEGLYLPLRFRLLQRYLLTFPRRRWWVVRQNTSLLRDTFGDFLNCGCEPRAQLRSSTKSDDAGCPSRALCVNRATFSANPPLPARTTSRATFQMLWIYSDRCTNSSTLSAERACALSSGNGSSGLLCCLSSLIMYV